VKAVSEAGAFCLVSLGAPHRCRASSVNLSPDWHLTELRCRPAMLHGPANLTKDCRPTSLTGVPLLPRFTVVDSIGELLSILFPPPKLIPRTPELLKPPTPTPSPPAIDGIDRASPPSAVSQGSPAF
jgi:hypothetical protein